MEKLNNFLQDRKSIIVFSVPRSGTHLVMQYLMEQGFTEWNPDVKKCGIYNVFNCPKYNYYVFAGHISGLLCADKFLESGLKGIYITRNPLDVVVSQAHHIRDSEKSHFMHKVFEKADYPSCINFVLDGLYPMVNIYIQYKNQDRWGDLDNVFTVSYEELLVKFKVEKPFYKEYFRNGGINEWQNYKTINWGNLIPFAESRGYKLQGEQNEI